MMLLPRLHQWGGSGKLLYTEIATNQQSFKVSPDMDKMKNIDLEFLHTLHIEKIRTQNERAELVKEKLAFITIFFGIGSVNFGFWVDDLFWLLYFVPLIAICFDLEIMSANSRIKRIGVSWADIHNPMQENLNGSGSIFALRIETILLLPPIQSSL